MAKVTLVVESSIFSSKYPVIGAYALTYFPTFGGYLLSSTENATISYPFPSGSSLYC